MRDFICVQFTINAGVKLSDRFQYFFDQMCPNLICDFTLEGYI